MTDREAIVAAWNAADPSGSTLYLNTGITDVARLLATQAAAVQGGTDRVVRYFR